MKGCKFVTPDTDSFYININTEHAIKILERWFNLHGDELPLGFPVLLVLLRIRCLIENNDFIFGRKFFV